jgi:MFS family permease
MPSDDQPYLFSYRRTLLIVTGVVSGVFVVSVNQAMLVVSAPTIVSDLGGLSSYSWIFSIYFLASTITIPTWSRLADQYGRRWLFASTLILFMSGSLICALAPSLPVLFLGRALQGVGAGGTVPIGMAATADIMAPRQRGKWLGYETSLAISAQFAGPFIGGLITQEAGWRWAFGISMPFALVSLAITCFAMKIPAHGEKHRIDVVGSLLLAGLLVAGLLGLTLGGVTMPWGSAPIISLFVGCAVLTGVFAVWERRVSEPIVPLSLYKHRTFLAASLMVWGSTGSMWAINTYVPLFAQGALGSSPARSGLILLPFGVASFVFSFIFGRVMSRTGHFRRQLFMSPVLTMLGLILLTRMGPSAGEVQIAPILVVCGLGLALGNATTIAVQNAVPLKMMATALGGLQFARILGGAIMLNVFGIVMNSRVKSELDEQLPVDSPLRKVSPDKLIAGTVHLSKADTATVHNAFGHAIPTVFYVSMPLVAVTFLAAFLVVREPLRNTIKHVSEIESSEEIVSTVEPQGGAVVAPSETRTAPPAQPS